MNKKRIVSLVIVTSIIINVVLVSVWVNDKKEDERTERWLLSRADTAIDRAVNTSGIAAGEWEDMSVESLIQTIGQVENEFKVATENMVAVDAYFLPTKIYAQQSRYFIQKLVEEGKSEKLYEEYKIEYLNMQHMWKFIAENQIIELGIDEVRSRWDEHVQIDISHMEEVIKDGDMIPEDILKDNSQADFFVMNDIIYMNVEGVDWVKKAELSKGDLIGEIMRTGIKKDFHNWDATELEVKSEVYGCREEKMLVLVNTNGELIPYMKWIEG